MSDRQIHYEGDSPSTWLPTLFGSVHTWRPETIAWVPEENGVVFTPREPGHVTAYIVTPLHPVKRHLETRAWQRV